MFVRFVFIILVIGLLIFLGEMNQRRGFNNLKFTRSLEKNKVIVGEEFSIKTTLENNKRLPVAFLIVSEKVPNELKYIDTSSCIKNGVNICHLSKYNISGFQRVKRTYTLKADKRGAYSLRDIEITVGDIFGFSAETKEEENFSEVVIYPKIQDINSYDFNTTNFQGDNTVRRWIHKDPLYVKGIREYNVEDRMKDIHWKSSLKMDKLMVKDYDYTSERELVIITNVECGQTYWSCIEEKTIEKAINIGVSLASKAIKESIPTGMWTNSQLVNYWTVFPNEVKPSLKSLNNIMELSARMSYNICQDFHVYLKNNIYNFDVNCTYVIITPFLNEESVNIISKLVKKGMKIKIIDVSRLCVVPLISGVEKINVN